MVRSLFKAKKSDILTFIFIITCNNNMVAFNKLMNKVMTKSILEKKNTKLKFFISNTF